AAPAGYDEVGDQRGDGGERRRVHGQQRDLINTHFGTTAARARAASTDSASTADGSRPSARARTTSGPQDSSSVRASPTGASRCTAGVGEPCVTWRSRRRKYAAASAAPSAATTAS